MSTKGGRRSTGGSWLRWRVVAVTAALAAGALFAASCGDDDGDSATAASADSDPALAYSECMRENGVPEFPDPVNGQLQIQATPDSGLDPTSPEWQAAEQACQSLAPSGGEQGAGTAPEVEAQALEHAQCMRENGVPDFPDPNVDGGRITTQLSPEVAESPQFEAAQAECGATLSGSGTAP